LQALEDHNTAIALDPNNKNAYNNRASTWWGLFSRRILQLHEGVLPVKRFNLIFETPVRYAIVAF